MTSEVTALVSTYRSAAFIERCLLNLASQTIAKAIEVIVVDADSPENEGEIVANFARGHPSLCIRYFRTPTRISVYEAWNFAIKNASGRYLISTSTNDLLRVDALEKLKAELDSRPEIALVYGDSSITDDPEGTFENHKQTGKHAWPEYSLADLMKNCLVGPHPMWRKSLHEELGYFDELYLAIADQDFWIRIGLKYDLYHLEQVTGVYLALPDSLSRSGDLPGWETLHVHSRYQLQAVLRLANMLSPSDPMRIATAKLRAELEGALRKSSVELSKLHRERGDEVRAKQFLEIVRAPYRESRIAPASRAGS